MSLRVGVIGEGDQKIAVIQMVSTTCMHVEFTSLQPNESDNVITMHYSSRHSDQNQRHKQMIKITVHPQQSQQAFSVRPVRSCVAAARGRRPHIAAALVVYRPQRGRGDVVALVVAAEVQDHGEGVMEVELVGALVRLNPRRALLLRRAEQLLSNVRGRRLPDRVSTLLLPVAHVH